MSESRTVNRDRVLVDAVRESPVDTDLRRFRRKLLVALLVVVASIVLAFAWRFLRDSPETYESAEEHFKYGSIGSEPGGSLTEAIGGVLPPYDIFRVLPAICPDKLPGGYASLGLIFEQGHDMPIGVSKRKRLGFEQVGLNCAGCHTGTYRASPQEQRKIVLGMPAHSLDLQGFFNFVTSCAIDPRFTPDNVIGKIEAAGGDLGFIDRYLYRRELVSRTREATGALRQRVDLLLNEHAPQWGLGRVDTFNPYKAIQFNWPLAKLPPRELIGASDYPPLWNQRPRDGMQLHWDGNNTSVDERNLSASLGAGVTPVTIDHARLKRVRDWIWTLPPPAYPFPINKELAARGEQVYAQHCVACHADHRFRENGYIEPAWKVGQVDPIEKIRTDPYRLQSYTLLFASNQYTLYPNTEYQFRHFRKTFGYANQPLDAIWARAPYLHNGSVPTLRDLLDAPEERPKAFYRGYDVFDQEKVGFRSDVAEESGRKFFKYDTALPGNGNAGHVYGTDLAPDEKNAIVEYMKRL